MQNKNVNVILLVDDDADEYMLFELALKEINPEIKLVHKLSCSAGLKEIEDCKADLIFLDLKLDARTGYDCLKALKASARFCNIPVVVYSNSNNPQDIKFSYELGAELFFTKTTYFQELVQALKEIMSMPWHNPKEWELRYKYNEKSLAFKLKVE